MERLVTIVLSTAHVRFEDIRQMESDARDPDATLQTFDGHYGVCLVVPPSGSITEEAAEKEYSESVMKLIGLARENGADLILLDRDGDKLDVSGLDVHEW